MVLGVLTALLGAVMCLAQRHLKRLLAYSTIAHVGLFVRVGHRGLAGHSGAALYIAGHAGVKCALFLLAGTMLNRYGSVDELDLFGRGGHEPGDAGGCSSPAGSALAGLPPFGTGLGKAVSEEAAPRGLRGRRCCSCGLRGDRRPRCCGRRRGSTGARRRTATEKAPDDQHRTRGDEQPDTRALRHNPVSMVIPIVVLLLGGLAVGVVPHAAEAAAHAAERLIDGTGYIDQALTNAPPTPLRPEPKADWTSLGVLLGVLSTLLACGFAALGLWAEKLPSPLRVAGTGLRPLMQRAAPGALRSRGRRRRVAVRGRGDPRRTGGHPAGLIGC